MNKGANTPPRICVVDDDPAVLASMDALLDSWGFTTMLCQSGTALLEVEAHSCKCLLMDVRMPGPDGISVVETLRSAGCRAPIIIMTGHGDVGMAVRAMRSGADDFIEKPFDDEDLVDRIRTLLNRAALATPDGAWLASLTAREREVLEEVVAGHPNKIIAYHLGISQKTVELHRSRMMAKSGAGNLSSLVRMALKAGIDPD